MIVGICVLSATLFILVRSYKSWTSKPNQVKKHGKHDASVKPSSMLPSPKGLPLLGNLLDLKSQREGKIMEEWAYQLGPIYSFSAVGKQFYVISDLETIMHIFKSRPHDYYRGPIIGSVFKDLNAMGLFSEQGEDWKRSR